MWKRLVRGEKDGLKDRFVKGGFEGVRSWQEICWQRQGIREYFRQARQFKEELLVLVHLSGGAPARATELLSIGQTNGLEARSQRGIFINDGTVSFVTAYHKGFSASHKSKIIHRYMPKEVGEIVVAYLWLVEPFIRQLQKALITENKTSDDSPWMWQPRPEEEWAINKDEEVEELIEEEDTAQNSKERAIEKAEEREDKGSKTSQPVEASNVDGFWDTDRVRRVIYRETQSRIGVKIGVALWRQAYPAIQRELTRNPDIRQAVDQIYEGQPRAGLPSTAPAPEEVRAQQAGHDPYTEEMIYGLLLTESLFTTISEKEQFRKVSADWHRLLGFQSLSQCERTNPDVRKKATAEREAAESRRFRQMQEVNIDVQLTQFYGRQDIEFRGVQQAVLEAICNAEPFVLAVMPTGGGKSLLFMLPAAASRDGVTIVVVPMTALRQDMAKRGNEKGITCEEWNGKRPPYSARIVLVTPESAATLSFSRFIDEKRRTNQLERIVIDKCHLIMESTDSWRPKVRELRMLAVKGV